MAEVKIKEGELTTADLASFGIVPKQPDGPEPAKGQEPGPLGRAAASEPMPLFSEPETGDL
jgi:hypothetical protein